MIYPLLYSAFYWATKCAGLFSHKLARAHRERRGLLHRVKGKTTGWKEGTWWVHIASSGELEQALPILDLLRKEHPDDKIFLSYFSPSAKDAVALEIKRREPVGIEIPWDASDYSPFDFRSSARNFLKTLRPKCFVTIHRELWPGIVSSCKENNVPILLLAASFPKREKPLPQWQRKQLEQLDAIGVTRKEAADWLKTQVRGPEIRVVGDPRVERVLSRRQMAKPAPWLSFFKGELVFLAASVWPKDFEQLWPGLENLRAENWRIILVPHEPKKEFVDMLFSRMKNAGWKPRLWSRWLEEPDHECSLIIDRVGLLAELYQVSQMVFVGGSFSHRVHNVLEPAAYGCRLFTGYRITNSLEALELKNEGLLVEAANSQELACALSYSAKQPLPSKDPLPYLTRRAHSAQDCISLLNSTF